MMLACFWSKMKFQVVHDFVVESTRSLGVFHMDSHIWGDLKILVTFTSQTWLQSCCVWIKDMEERIGRELGEMIFLHLDINEVERSWRRGIVLLKWRVMATLHLLRNLSLIIISFRRRIYLCFPPSLLPFLSISFHSLLNIIQTHSLVVWICISYCPACDSPGY